MPYVLCVMQESVLRPLGLYYMLKAKKFLETREFFYLLAN